MSADELVLLTQTAEAVLASAREAIAVDTPAGDTAAEAVAGWKLLADQGMTRVSVAEPIGAGEPLRFLGALLRAAGRAASSVPLIDTHVGATLLAAAGLPVDPDEGAAIAVGLDPRLLCPSARPADRLAVVHPGLAETVVVATLDGPAARLDVWNWAHLGITPTTNLAGEPVALLDVESLPTPESSSQVPVGVARAAALVDAVGRSLMIVGAAEIVLEQTLRYVSEREQFGRALAAFQSVQQTAATMASMVVSASVAADAALLGMKSAAFTDSGPEKADADIGVLACRIQCSRTAAYVARAAHQLHGAIGFTQEHPLRHATTRLTAWRAHGPSPVAVARQLGQRGFTAGELWPLVVGRES